MPFTLEEAQAELSELRGLADTGQSLAVVKERIARLYLDVCRKQLRKCKCKNVLEDALAEIYATIQKYKRNMDTYTAKARLVNGVVLHVGAKVYTNANLTDEVARQFLAQFPQRKDWFTSLPDDEAAKAEPVAEVVEAAPSPTPKKSKKSKKRKS